MDAFDSVRPLRAEIVPITLADGKLFVATHHRHNDPPIGWKFGVGLAVDGELIGVAMAGRPVARKLQDANPRAIEILRVAVTGAKNANSALYGAVCRMAEAAGYLRAYTYTLPEESGASLRACGFVIDDEYAGDVKGWSTRTRPRMETNLFGEARTPIGRKIRWRKDFRPRVLALGA